ncbi:Na+/H+ antiporter subunit B [Anditalea andensis]|uniref:Monovalent cation/H+ antiporter subunit B n=1 Tax=Anditalea andensis TaxID=1048983 RepID=A0A074L140_9BACT|nr:Na+/H+ antiporter subunit B [Anditalea andensis]KEO74180.1 monovalent cation/H+ antiporter subunit B [Anditalea andensis]
MKTIIFKTASSYLLPLLLLFAIFILLRGHYLPGGGFVGGLIAAIAFVLHSFANGIERTRGIIKFHPGFLMPIGLSIALCSGLAPLLVGSPFMTGLWYHNPIPVIGMIGTALIFDIGVFLVVIGVVLTIIFTISETI